MSDSETPRPRKPLTLKGSQPGEVKQTFSHGRTNKVVVEVKRRRKLLKPGETPPPPPPPAPEPAPAPAPAPVAKKPAPKKADPAAETPQERVALNCTVSAHRLPARDALEREIAPQLLEAVRDIEAASGIH